MRTNTNKFISWALLTGMALISSAHAATQIGTGTVTSSGGYTTSVMWNGTNTANSASGTITGLVIKAKVQPSLNMEISGSGTIDLGTISAAGYSTGTVNIEIGTNAPNGASVTASSVNGGLKNGLNFINNQTTDGVADNYRFSAAAGTGTDSSYSIAQTFWTWTEIFNSTAYSVYTSDKPQAMIGVDDILFSIAAKPDAQTAAGDYTDLVNVTVTGNF